MKKRTRVREYENPRVGEKYGEWSVVDGEPLRKNNEIRFKMKCKCGVEAFHLKDRIKRGELSHCQQCAFKKRRGRTLNSPNYVSPKSKLNTLKPGLRKGDRTVIGELYKKNDRYLIKTICKCGAMQETNAYAFLAGSANSCLQCSGKRHSIHLRNKKVNQKKKVRIIKKGTPGVWVMEEQKEYIDKGIEKIKRRHRYYMVLAFIGSLLVNIGLYCYFFGR